VTVDTTAASSIPAGSYFEVFAPSGRSSIYWFEIDGVGTAPSFPSSLVKKIVLASTDTVEQVTDNLVANTNTQVEVPDLRGMFIRGMDDGRGLDPDAASRTDPTFSFVEGDVVGSTQLSAVEEHTHTVTNFATNPGSGGDFPSPSGSQQTGGVVGANVSTETRAVNTYLTFIIKT